MGEEQLLADTRYKIMFVVTGAEMQLAAYTFAGANRGEIKMFLQRKSLCLSRPL